MNDFGILEYKVPIASEAAPMTTLFYNPLRKILDKSLYYINYQLVYKAHATQLIVL